MTSDRRRAELSLTGYILVLLAALFGLHLLGSGALAAPPLTAGQGALQRWMQARDPAVAAFALVRGGVVIVTWYLLATALAAVALRMVGAARAASVVDALSLPPARRLVQAVAGLSLAASAVGATGGFAAPAGPAGATVRSGSDEDVAVMQSLPEEEVVMLRLPDHPATPAPAPAPRSWTIRSGEHFWGVAEEVLRSAWGRVPRDREITPYWRQIVEANRSRLADANNEDLLIPGQVIELPSPPPAAG